MTTPTQQAGSFCWNELMTNDVDAAKTFYGALFGWTMANMQTDDMPYTIASAADTEVAGIMGMPPEAGGMPPNWGAYVAVDNVEESAKKAEALGGKIIMEPRDIPDVGKFCVITDPQGAVLSMITLLNK